MENPMYWTPYHWVIQDAIDKYQESKAADVIGQSLADAIYQALREAKLLGAEGQETR